MSYVYLDKHHRKLVPGQKIKVQSTAGRYGQVSVFTGTLKSIDNYHCICLALDHPVRENCGKFGSVARQAGDEVYVAMSVIVRHSKGQAYLVYSCANTDWEHGHETFVEILGT